MLVALEGHEGNLRAFLGLARSFEIFVDSFALSKNFTWSPLRVATEIELRRIPGLILLSEQEIAAACSNSK
ncbi:MAG: hypothetical protein JWS10_2325 [Cypionkella sp.]|uniref:hypothetical protein n=1 Tax=Cypionkella sp. TaxID=2811411 RepID=UPI002616AF70|nr:hypothetical protein [Cypionkella sp.]MDB5659710.1 hypothetical protein [Cypionkella sp.]